jgi:nicotinate phosphoribosyltransferase
MKFSTLLIDHHNLTMAYGYWKAGKADQDATFRLSFNIKPFKGNYAIACGLGELIDSIKKFQFIEEDISRLANFSPKFISYLQQLKFTCDIDAMPEGTLVFATEPMLLIKGPLAQCLLLETIIVNIINFATLVATKASKMFSAANYGTINEFSLRHTQSLNSITASRAAYIGGCTNTSNVLAAKKLNIPLCSVMSHNWVKSFPSELEAFRIFADIMQDQTVLSLDTYNVRHGIQNAITIGTELRRRKHELLAVQLNFTNVAKFAPKVRKLLNQARFKNTKIFADGDFDEHLIKKLQKQKMPIDAWNTSAKLVTESESCVLKMTYELIALHNDINTLDITGMQQVKRFYRQQKLSHDVIYDQRNGIKLPKNMHQYKSKDLLVPIFQNGKLIYQLPDLPTIKSHAADETTQFSKSAIRNYRIYL